MHLLSVVVFFVWLLALARTLINLALMGHLDAADEPASRPLVSLIIPARNEARAIAATLRGLLAQDYADFEVIVVDDRSTDDTGAFARSFHDPRVFVIDGEEPPPGWLGKPWALHQGSRHARGELLLFLDADIRYEPCVVRAAVAHLQRHDLAMLTLFPHFEMHGFWENVVMPLLGITALVIFPVWISNRTRISALAIGGGPGNLVRRDIYERLGGHEPLKDAVVDDIGLARVVRRGGGSTEAVMADRVVSVRMYHGAREILDGFTKNAFAGTGRSYAIAAMLAAVIFITDLLPFVLACAGDLFAIGCVALILIVRVIVFGALRYRLDSAIFGAPLMAAFWLVILCRSVWRTGIRRELQWRGRTYAR